MKTVPFFLTGSIFIMILVSAVSADTLIVPDNFPTIQDAFDALQDGDSILIQTGTYTGEGFINLVLPTIQFDLRGASNPEDTVINCNFSGYFLHSTDEIAGPGTVVEGLTVINAFSSSGAMDIASDLTLKNCIFHNNRSSSGGGAIQCHASPRIIACVFTENSAMLPGEALSIQNGSPLIDRCVFFANSNRQSNTTIHAVKSDVCMVNSIIWEENPFTSNKSRWMIEFCDVKGGSNIPWLPANCIDVDPRFLDPENHDFSLNPDSPCIDSGDPLSRLDTDASRADIGAMKYGGSLPVNTYGGVLTESLELTSGIYLITEDLIVSRGTDLTLRGDIELAFRNDAGIVVYGSLDINSGTQINSYFHPHTTQKWFYGIGLHGAESCVVSDLQIEDASKTNGGGIACFDCSPQFWRTCVAYSRAFLYGGGFYFKNSNTLMLNCTAFHCIAYSNDNRGGRGGGLAFVGSDVNFFYGHIIGNSVFNYGGGLYADWDSDVNLAYSGIIENYSHGSEGGITAYNGNIWNSIIHGNSALNDVGGVWFLNGDLTTCIISNNTAQRTCGGVSNDFGNVGNCLIVNNSAPTGSALYGYGGTNSLFQNVTISGNKSDDYYLYIEDNASLILTDSILWGNEGNLHASEHAVFTFCDIENGEGEDWFGEACIELNPFFVDGSWGSHYLSQIDSGQSADSPCVSAGSNFSHLICFPTGNIEVCMAELTTRTDHTSDSGKVDFGFHYDNAIPVTPTPRSTRTPRSFINNNATPTPTPPPLTPQPTATALFNHPIKLELLMPDELFEEGDVFWVTARLTNYMEHNLYTCLYVILEYRNEFFFYPLWSIQPDSFDEWIDPGVQTFMIVEPFYWPESGMIPDSALLWSAATDLTGEFLSPITYRFFSWN